MNSLRENVDSLITIPNQRLLAISGATLSMMDAFKKADEVLLNAVQGISDLINHTGLINSDFADVKTIMQNKGLALMGIGYGEGEHRAVEAATNAISSPLLEDVSIDGATGIIINITGGDSLKIHEVNEATTLIMEAAHEDAEIIFGTVIDAAFQERVKVTVIATGLGNSKGNSVYTVMNPNMVGQTKQSAPAPELQVQSPTPPPAPVSASADTMTGSSMCSRPPAISDGEGLPAKPESPTIEIPSDGSLVASIAAMPIAPVMPGESGIKSQGTEGGELARARAIAHRLGITNLTDDEYDIPTYVRRQQEREL
jgi:hypothetical protein